MNPERHSKITATVRIDGYSMFCLLENYEAMMSSCAEEYPAPTFTELVQNSFLVVRREHHAASLLSGRADRPDLVPSRPLLLHGRLQVRATRIEMVRS